MASANAFTGMAESHVMAALTDSSGTTASSGASMIWIAPGMGPVMSTVPAYVIGDSVGLLVISASLPVTVPIASRPVGGTQHAVVMDDA